MVTAAAGALRRGGKLAPCTTESFRSAFGSDQQLGPPPGQGIASNRGVPDNTKGSRGPRFIPRNGRGETRAVRQPSINVSHSSLLGHPTLHDPDNFATFGCYGVCIVAWGGPVCLSPRECPRHFAGSQGRRC